MLIKRTCIASYVHARINASCTGVVCLQSFDIMLYQKVCQDDAFGTLRNLGRSCTSLLPANEELLRNCKFKMESISGPVIAL